MTNHPNRARRYRIKGTFRSSTDGTFVRYWSNGPSLTGWLYPELKAKANVYTKSAGERFIASSKRHPRVTYELELVEG